MTRRAAFALTIAALALLCACAGGSRTTAIAGVQGSPTPRPRPLPTPARSSAEITDPTFHVGQEVFITDEGFVPQQLVSVVGEAISFVNETSGPVEVRFTAIDFRTGPIEPGARASYTPDGAYSIAFHLGGDRDVTGAIQVQPYFMPGEDPAAEDRLDAYTPGEHPDG